MDVEQDYRREPSARSYILCSSPRTGSNMLARALMQLDIGRPFEYFNPMAIRAYCARSGAKRLHIGRYFEYLRYHRADSRGLFGLKSHFHQLTAIFPQEEARLSFLARFRTHILIKRKNKIQQAISNYRALRSGVWYADDLRHAQSARLSSTIYDGNAIYESLAFLRNDEEGWISTLNEIGSAYLTVYFEDIALNHAAVLRQIISHIGVEVEEVYDNPSTQILGDDRSLEWEQRFRSDFPNCNQ